MLPSCGPDRCPLSELGIAGGDSIVLIEGNTVPSSIQYNQWESNYLPRMRCATQPVRVCHIVYSYIALMAQKGAHLRTLVYGERDRVTKSSSSRSSSSDRLRYNEWR